MVSMIVAATVLTGCGSTTESDPPSGSASPGTSLPSTGPASSLTPTGGTLTVTGSLSLSLQPAPHVTTPCNLPNTGSTAGGLADHTSGSLILTDGKADYLFQFYVGPGTTTLPADFGKTTVALWPKADPTKKWAIGTNTTATQSGTITMNGKHGTIDAAMAPDPPAADPALSPIHVQGTFDCP